MAVYRADRSRRVVGIGIVALVAGMSGGVVVGRLTAPDLPSQLAELRQAAAPIGSAAEVVRVEYPKLLAGGADPGGAEGAVARMRATLADVHVSLGALDDAGTDDLAGSVDRLAALVADRAPAPQVNEAVDGVEAALAAVLRASP